MRFARGHFKMSEHMRLWERIICLRSSPWQCCWTSLLVCMRAKVPMQEFKLQKPLENSWAAEVGGWLTRGDFKLHDHCWNSEIMKQKLTFYIYRMEEEENEGVITIINIIIRRTNIQASLTRKHMLKGDKIWVSLYQTKGNRNLIFNNMVICFL